MHTAQNTIRVQLHTYVQMHISWIHSATLYYTVHSSLQCGHFSAHAGIRQLEFSGAVFVDSTPSTVAWPVEISFQGVIIESGINSFYPFRLPRQRVNNNGIIIITTLF